MTFDDHALNELAIRVMTAQDRRGTLAPMSSDAPLDIPTSYVVADRVHRMRIAQGAVPVGRKIGFTNRNIWDEYGVHQPIWGWMYEHTLVHSRNGHARISIEHFAEPKIEPEIVLHLASAPTVTDDLAALFSCVDWIAHGFEIVQCPYPGWKLGAADAIASSGLHGCLVLGQKVPVSSLGADPIETLANFTVTLYCEGDQRGSGSGANVLGSPLAALAHLLPLAGTHPPHAGVSAGELITTGTLTAAFDIESGQTWHTELHGIALPGLVLSLGA